MEVHYNVTGPRRKELALTVAKITGMKAEYQYMPTCAYKIGLFTLTKDGTLEFPDEEKSAEKVLAALSSAGFEMEENNEEGPTGLTIAIPKDKVNVDNMKRLLEAKGGLIKKAIGIDALPVEEGETSVTFPWFDKAPEPEEAKAYTHLIAALCQMSQEQKRINAAAKEVENEKYAFRCFLLRLGFIGPEYKVQRKILLQNLSGSSAFKGGTRHADAE